MNEEEIKSFLPNFFTNVKLYSSINKKNKFIPIIKPSFTVSNSSGNKRDKFKQTEGGDNHA